MQDSLPFVSRQQDMKDKFSKYTPFESSPEAKSIPESPQRRKQLLKEQEELFKDMPVGQEMSSQEDEEDQGRLSPEQLKDSFKNINLTTHERSKERRGKQDVSPSRNECEFNDSTDFINEIPPEVSYTKASQIRKNSPENKKYKTVRKSADVVFSDEEENAKVGEEYLGAIKRTIAGLSPSKGVNSSLTMRNNMLKNKLLDLLLQDIKAKSARTFDTKKQELLAKIWMTAYCVSEKEKFSR